MDVFFFHSGNLKKFPCKISQLSSRGRIILCIQNAEFFVPAICLNDRQSFFFFFNFFLLYTNDMVIDNSQRHNYMTLQQNIHKTKTHSGIH